MDYFNFYIQSFLPTVYCLISIHLHRPLAKLEKEFYGLYCPPCLTVMTYCVVQFDSFDIVGERFPLMLVAFAVQLMVMALGVPLGCELPCFIMSSDYFPVFPGYGMENHPDLPLLSSRKCCPFYQVMASMSEEFLWHRSVMIGLMFLSALSSAHLYVWSLARIVGRYGNE